VTQIKTKWTVKSWREPVHYKHGVHVVYSREMRRTIIMAVLLALLTVVQGQKLDVSFSEESQELEPEGSIVGIDSVVVDAKFAELSIPISLTIERINNPEVLVPAIATTETKPISPYYQVRSPKRTMILPRATHRQYSSP
jgi:hypothetical protein